MRSKKYQKITAIIIIVVVLAMAITSVCDGILCTIIPSPSINSTQSRFFQLVV